MNKYLVTGGLGFIGSNFINTYFEKLSEAGKEFEIHCVDKGTYAGSINNLKSQVRESKNFYLHEIDICGQEVIDLMRNNYFSFCAHFAAESHVDRSIDDPSVFLTTNVLGTANLLNGWKTYQNQRFLHISTDEVYGSLKVGEATELAKLDPSSPYSASKAASDLLVLAYVRTFDVNAIVTRCTNNFGLNQNTEKLIPKLIANAVNGKKLTIYSDGLNVREWIHVTDHVLALIHILESQNLNSKIYNIGSGSRKTNLEVVEIIKNVSGINDIEVEHTKDRPGHDYRYAVDSGMIQSEFNWSPKKSLESGVLEMVNHYKAFNTFETS